MFYLGIHKLFYKFFAMIVGEYYGAYDFLYTLSLKIGTGRGQTGCGRI